MLKVLIADDQHLLLDLMQHMLSDQEDIEVVGTATDGQQVIEMSKQYQPDVVLMDIMMPQLNGIEATKEIKKLDQDVKVLILSSSNREEDVHEAINNGADGYVLKSINEDELVLAVKSVHAHMEVLHHDIRAYAKFALASDINKKNGKKTIIVQGFPVELTRQEIQVIKMIVEGLSTGEMARSIHVSEGRLRNIITDVISKLMLKDRTQVAVFALKNNLV